MELSLAAGTLLHGLLDNNDHPLSELVIITNGFIHLLNKLLSSKMGAEWKRVIGHDEFFGPVLA